MRRIHIDRMGCINVFPEVDKKVKPNKIRKVHIDSMGCINVFPEVDKNKKQTK